MAGPYVCSEEAGVGMGRHTLSGAGKRWDQVPATQISTTFRSEGGREVSWTPREKRVTEEKVFLSARRELKLRASRKQKEVGKAAGPG